MNPRNPTLVVDVARIHQRAHLKTNIIRKYMALLIATDFMLALVNVINRIVPSRSTTFARFDHLNEGVSHAFCFGIPYSGLVVNSK